MNRAIAFLLLALPLGLAALQSAGADALDASVVHSAVFDVRSEVPLGSLALGQAGCPGQVTGSTGTTSMGALDLDTAHARFRWSETDPGGTPPGQPPGMTSKGCATVGFGIAIPPGTARVELRFAASREVTCAVATPFGAAPGCPRFQQTVILNGTAGGDVRSDFYNETEAAAALQTRPVGPSFVPDGQSHLHGTWLFREGDSSLDPTGFPVRPTGAAYASTIQAPMLSFLGVAAHDAPPQILERRSGTRIFHDVEVAVPVTAEILAAGDPDLRVAFDAAVSFSQVRAPDGTLLTDRVTRVAEGPDGFDRSKVLLERDANTTQITVPAELLRAHGPGVYVLVESQELPLASLAVLQPIAILLLLVPVPFAFVAARKARRFEAQAFGGFRRSARNLRWALLVALLYYLVVVGGAFLAGGLDDMTTFPLSAAGIFLYLQLVLAAAAFTSLYLVARELHGMTVPKEVVQP